MSEDKRYNGWTNYETWNVNLWITNDEYGDRYWREAAQDAYDGAEAERSFTRMERATLDLAEKLKDEVTEANPLTDEASMYSDLLGAALSEVNWYEIAEHFVEDVDQEAEEVEEDEVEA